jgi:hypothetical protein
MNGANILNSQLSTLNSQLPTPMPTVLTTKLDRHSDLVPTDRLSLTAEERQRARCPFTTLGNVEVYLQLERGIFLKQGDRLQSDDGSLVVEIMAKPERVMAVTAVKSIASGLSFGQSSCAVGSHGKSFVPVAGFRIARFTSASRFDGSGTRSTVSTAGWGLRASSLIQI